MAYMFNDDKSKNDVTEKPLIMTVKHLHTITDWNSSIYTLDGIYGVPTGYTPVGLLNVTAIDSGNAQLLNKIGIIQDRIIEYGPTVIRVQISLNKLATDTSEVLLVFNILFVRSEFASIELSSVDDDSKSDS